MKLPHLKKILPEIKTGVSLKKYNTFRIGGKAKYFFEAKTEKDLLKVLTAVRDLKLPLFILGGGSNVLFNDEEFDGVVIKVSTKGLEVKDYKPGEKIVYVEAGTPLSFLVNKAKELSLSGLEWATGIPGTIGGAVFGNAAAFGFSIGEIVKTVEVFDLETLKKRKFNQKECCFEYKESIFKKEKKYVILRVGLVLRQGNKKEIEKRIKEYLEKRKKSQPFCWSAGCVFKNIKIEKPEIKLKIKKALPEAAKFLKSGFLPAGYLIDKCGLKGKKIGKAEVSQKHANFIVNKGGAKAKDIIKLIRLVKESVRKKLGIELEREVVFVEDFTIDSKFLISDNEIREAEYKNKKNQNMPKKKSSRRKSAKRKKTRKTAKKKTTKKKTSRKKASKKRKKK
ncbi:UDP-N-acetylmuramate dehydrogenase [bacterium]|nr:UDP-N-acetylmuramate dehydrogenase [bacterium]